MYLTWGLEEEVDHSGQQLKVITWNSCGMEQETILTLLDVLDIDFSGWDAVLLQEGPMPKDRLSDTCYALHL